MIFVYFCRIASLASLILLILKLHNHAYSFLTVVAGLFLTSIMFSLGFGPQRRHWDARFLIALITTVGIAAFWFFA